MRFHKAHGEFVKLKKLTKEKKKSLKTFGSIFGGLEANAKKYLND
jgi:hypothetical protein